MSKKKKLTDEEIVKALECCTKKGHCLECPYKIKGIDCISRERSEKDWLDLIHRLQSENEKFKTELRKECEEHEEFTKKAKAEIERLKKEADKLSDHLSEKQNALLDLQDDFDNLLAEGKQQAVKDTAKEIFERLAKRRHQGIDGGGFFVEYTLRPEDLDWFEVRYGMEVE